jgi:hypothetical protein
MPIGSAVHARTFPLCESLNYREWSGFYAVSSYEAHQSTSNAIRNASALIDVAVVRYRLTGRDVSWSIASSPATPSARGRPGLLRAVVRRARQGDRRGAVTRHQDTFR